VKKVLLPILALILVTGLGAGVVFASPGIWETNPGTEVSVTDDTITLSIARNETPDQQPVAIHGATIELPPAEQIYVEFNYDLHTWDSYNPITVAGTGYWDLFSISVSQDKYWNLSLSDPLDGDPLDIGFQYGGTLYGDGILDSTSGSGSATMNASIASTNYLNVVLDTATAPDHNGNYGSWGTIEITKIEILGVPEVTKELVYAYPDEGLGGDDWILDLSEKWYFTLNITVTNNISLPITNVIAKDNFGGDLEVVSVDGVAVNSSTAAPLKGKQKEATYSTSVGNVTILWTGKTEKAHLFWDVEDGTLSPGETHTLMVVVATDQNPKGKQEYTSEVRHCLNSGATAKGFVTLPSGVWEVTDTTDEICVNTGDSFGQVLIYYGNGGYDPGSVIGEADFSQLKARYDAAGYPTSYTDVFPASLSPYKLIILVAPGEDLDDGTHYFTAAQVSAFQSFMLSPLKGRLVVMGDHSGNFGINTVNNLLGALGVGITQNADLATSDGDVCPPITDITADQITTGVSGLDLSATSSLNLTGTATSLVRLQSGWTCGSGTGGETVIAVDQIAGAPSRPGGDVIVIGDTQGIDDYALSDPQGDGIADNLVFADNLVGF
jgi:hypothetical protein